MMEKDSLGRRLGTAMRFDSFCSNREYFFKIAHWLDDPKKHKRQLKALIRKDLKQGKIYPFCERGYGHGVHKYLLWWLSHG